MARILLLSILSLVLSIVSGWTTPTSSRPRTFLLSSGNDIDQEISSVAAGSSRNEAILAASAAVTKEKCHLIGVKSLGVDYGLARTGLALTVGYSPDPFDIVDQTNATLLATEIVQTAAALQVAQIVLGLPLHKNGTEAEQTNLTRIFGQELATQALARLGPDVKVHLWDERYTSKEAAARAHAIDPNRWLYGTLDAEAACIILETYYNDNGEGAEIIELPEEIQVVALAEYEQVKEAEERQMQNVRDQREANMQKRKEAIERSKKLEEEMRANGTLGVSRKKKRKKKTALRKANKKKDDWIVL